MSLHSWLHNLRSALAPRRGQRHREPCHSLRAATHRPNLELLEARLTPSFSPAASFPVGGNPGAVVTGDFNNDGHLDLATGNSSQTANTVSVSVLLGDGSGSFGDAIDTAVFRYSGEDRVFLTAADFDNDGSDDLAVGTNVFLSNGDGTFTPVGSSVRINTPSVAADDFNNDGNIDLVYSSIAWHGFDGIVLGENLWVLPGDGHGGFGQALRSYCPDEYAGDGSMTVGDLNSDGNLDVVTWNGDGGSNGRVFLGNGYGWFTGSLFYTYVPATTVALGDFTADGIPDLIHMGYEYLFSYTGLGDGTFASFPPSFGRWFDPPTMLSDMAVGDFDGDGRLDAVTTDAVAGTVIVLPGNGAALTYTVGSSPSAIVVGDFNGDGRPDVATANAGSNSVSVLPNDGTYTPPPPPPPSLRIDDATVTEGNTGTVAAEFTVILSAASIETVTVAYTTSNGAATAGSDYQSASGTLTFAPGETSQTITVLVNGDRVGEPNETFAVNLSSATNATIADGQGLGTIVDDEPKISLNDVTVTEGNTGTVNATFTVSLSVAYDVAVAVHSQTANGSATASSDYAAASGDVIIAAGQTTKTFTIAVIGDRSAEPTENFVVNLSAATNGLIVDGQGVGTILDNEPRISISDVSKSEGRQGQTTLFTFTVTLSAAYDQAVTLSFGTVNGTAKTSDDDYSARTGTLTFNPGQTTKTITIEVKGDSKKETNETFYLDLFGNSTNTLFTKYRGLGTILNDD